MSNEELEAKLKQAYDIIDKLEQHLDYCGWGDSWERECSEGLRKELENFNNSRTEKG